MESTTRQFFFEELDKRGLKVQNYILQNRFVHRFALDDIRTAVTAYVRYGGKRLRPAILLFSCGAVGGDENCAISAAAAVELFHTFALVHDDIIDRDKVRRGQSTVHEFYARRHNNEKGAMRLSAKDARHYGISIAILTGDIQHGWGISFMSELTTEFGLDPHITIKLINELDTYVLNTLLEGEVLDIQYSHRKIESLTPELIESMLWKKTGVLYEFCGRAGATIGLGRNEDPCINALAKFASLCGTAFQLQDDILGVVGKEQTLGKPVGSDIREGKRTLLAHWTYHNSTPTERKRFAKILGNSQASDDEVQWTINLIREKGAVEWVSRRARALIEEARPHLRALPESTYKTLLDEWAGFMVDREF